MNIVKENVDELNAVVKLTVEATDYEEKVNNVLKDYRRKARIDGFRPGKVPFGMIKKMYYKPVLVDEVNKIVIDNLYKYISEENLEILGEPLPSENEQKTIDFDNDTNFEFVFDLGLSPQFELKLSPKDKIPFYTIKVEKKTIDETVTNYTKRFGKLESIDKAGEKSFLKGTFSEIDENNNIVEEGIKSEGTSLSVELIKDDKIKNQFVGLKKGDTINFDIKKAFPNNTEIASILKIDKEQVETVPAMYQLEVAEVTDFKDAEINQELFDKAFGEGKINSEEEFRARLKEDITKGFAQDSDYRYKVDAKDFLLNKHKIEIPEKFLKRWLLAVNKEKYTKEDIDKEWDKFEKDLKWQLIKGKIAKGNEMNAGDDEIIEYAKKFARMQYQQYGIMDIPDDHLTTYAQQMTRKPEEKNRIAEIVIEDKVYEYVKENSKVDEKEVTLEKFNKLFEN